MNFTTVERMNEELLRGPKEVLPSEYWVKLNKKNCEQLETLGYENFKRTVALNYFTLVSFLGDQRQFLMRKLPVTTIMKSSLQAFLTGKHDLFTRKESFVYNLQTFLLWEYVLSLVQDKKQIDQLEEPEEGNPPRVFRHGKLISQDLGNSILEFHSILSGVNKAEIQSVMELGAGYGRTAFVFLKLMPNLKYFVIDIPPALYVSQRYLTNEFPERKIFAWRPFERIEEIEDELAESSIAFFLPSQVHLLPNKIVDLFINISSLHEMQPGQIGYYFELIDRLTRKYLYLKEWKEIVIDGFPISQADYPVRPHWSRIFWRECAVQTQFFEALLKIGLRN